MEHQGRPGVDKYYMILHIRKMFWTEDGWPVVSPQRYTGENPAAVTVKENEGVWERIQFNYRLVPGFASEQILADFQEPVEQSMHSDGTSNDDPGNRWAYNPPWLELKWNNVIKDKVLVERCRDWENKKTCLLFTGFNNERTAVWGKK